MSDDAKSALTMAPVLFEHYCCHVGCKDWGGFGFSASKGVEVRWWCWEHYPHRDDRQAQRAQSEEAIRILMWNRC